MSLGVCLRVPRFDVCLRVPRFDVRLHVLTVDSCLHVLTVDICLHVLTVDVCPHVLTVDSCLHVRTCVLFTAGCDHQMQNVKENTPPVHRTSYVKLLGDRGRRCEHL